MLEDHVTDLLILSEFICAWSKLKLKLPVAFLLLIIPP